MSTALEPAAAAASALRALLDASIAGLNEIILGKEQQVRLCLACLLARGHPLIADTPGVGKTTLAHALARSLGTSSAMLAHRYALGIAGVDSVILGVKNRVELRECLDAEAQGPLTPQLQRQIDAAVGRR